MNRAEFAAGTLMVMVAVGPAVVAANLAYLDPVTARRWVWAAVCLATLMIGIAYGRDWVIGWQRRRRAYIRVRRIVANPPPGPGGDR